MTSHLSLFSLHMPHTPTHTHTLLQQTQLTKRPFSFVNLAITTICPLGTLINLHDGTTSQLRTYMVPEMQAIIDDNIKGSDTYTWSLGYRRLSSMLPSFCTAPYLIGLPKKETN